MIGGLLLAFVVGIAFTWLVVRSVRAGHGKFLAALGILCCGIALLLSLELEPGLGTTIFVNTIAVAILVAPVVLLLLWLFRHERSDRIDVDVFERDRKRRGMRTPWDKV